MNILHVYKDYFPILGGIENHVRVVAEAQARAGHQVTVLCCARTHQTTETMENNVRVIRAARIITFRSMPISSVFCHYAQQLNADVVHVHSPFPLGEWAVSRRKDAARFICTHHADVVRQKMLIKLYGPIYQQILQQVDAVIATSPVYLSTSKWLAPIQHKCHIVPLAVDTDHFTPPAKPFDGPSTILFAGRLRYYKGLNDLLVAMSDLPDLQLNIVGDGPMRRTWETQAKALKIADRVRFIGDVSDTELAEWYHKAHLFVLPANSRAEAFGTVLLEAMASGLPCITTDVASGTSWVVRHNETGLVVPPENSKALTAAIKQILSDKDQLATMSSAARQRVENNFNLDKMIADITSVYGV